MASPTCIIPAKRTSERLPGKNLMELGGKPLLAWAIEAAREADIFEGGVWVTTEDAETQAVAVAYGAFVHPRPMGYSQAKVTVRQVIGQFVRYQGDPKYDPIMIHQCTSPFVSATTMRQMVQAFLANEDWDILEARGPDVQFASPWIMSQAIAFSEPDYVVRDPHLEEFADLDPGPVDRILHAENSSIGRMLWKLDAKESVNVNTEDDFNAAELWLAEEMVGG